MNGTLRLSVIVNSTIALGLVIAIAAFKSVRSSLTAVEFSIVDILSLVLAYVIVQFLAWLLESD